MLSLEQLSIVLFWVKCVSAGCFMQVLFNCLIRDHDAKVFNPPVSVKQNAADRVVDIAFGGFRRWDGVYFLHIAEHGYTYENTLAFFPLFPLMVRAVGNSALFLLQYFMSYASVLLISAVIVNIACFVLSAMTLYELGRIALRSDTLAYRAAQFYCINPANIFFSAAYSESCYALLTFRGMLMLERNYWVSSAVFFAFSSAARSNGLVNIGFLLYRAARDAVAWILLYVQAKAKVNYSRFGLNVCQLGMLLVLCVAPFAAFQYHAYTGYCNYQASYRDLPEHVRKYGNKMGYRMPYMDPSVWCSSWLPLSYSYIQLSHWNVGFLKYYELKQIPNFLLATPIAVLCSCMILSYLCKHASYCRHAGLLPCDDAKHMTENNCHCLPKTCFVYIVHTAFLLIFGILCMHVQVRIQ